MNDKKQDFVEITHQDEEYIYVKMYKKGIIHKGEEAESKTGKKYTSDLISSSGWDSEKKKQKNIYIPDNKIDNVTYSFTFTLNKTTWLEE